MFKPCLFEYNAYIRTRNFAFAFKQLCYLPDSFGKRFAQGGVVAVLYAVGYSAD